MINNVVLVGRLTKDPELKMTQSNIAVSNFTIAVNKNYKVNDGDKEVDFINCVVWRAQAENLVKYMKKGSLIGVQGRIQTRDYEGDKGRVYVTEVLANSIQFLQSKNDTNQAPEPKNDYISSQLPNESDLPF